jgi:hypothetical protein
VKLFLDHGAALKKGFLSQTPFHSAVGAGTSDVVRLLQEFWPWTPLHFATSEGKADIVRLLVEGWPKCMREKDQYGCTPLHLAALGGGGGDVVRQLAEIWPEGKA